VSCIDLSIIELLRKGEMKDRKNINQTEGGHDRKPHLSYVTFFKITKVELF